jgi:hypothetical protein
VKVGVQTVIGALAGVTAIVTIAVFGYLTAVTPGGGFGWLGGSPSAAPAPQVAMAAIESFVDKDYRFKLVAPEPKWRVFDRAAADQTWFEANAAMLSDAGIVQLFVTRVGDISLDQAEEVAASWMGSEPVDRRALRWLDRDAVELRFDIGNGLRERLLLRDGYMYRFVVTSIGGPTGVTEADYPGLWSSLVMLAGKVEPGPFAPEPRDKRGLDWMIASGRWESATAGLAILPPPGWRLLTGRTLRSVRDDVDVQLVNTACGCYVSVQARATQDMTKAGSAKLTAEVAGARRDLVEVEQTVVSRTWAVQLDVGGTPVVIHAWSPAADGDRGVEALRPALASIELIDDARRTSLIAGFVATPHHGSAIGGDWVDRNGRFVHFGSGLVWERPLDGLWRITAGAEATAMVPDAVLVGEAIREEVTFAIAPADDLADYAGTMAAWLTDTFDQPAKKTDLTGVRPDFGDAAEMAWTAEGVKRVHQVAMLVGDNGRRFRVHIWGTRAAVTSMQKDLRSALAGIALTDVEETAERSGEYIHRRWGFAVELPGWRRNEREDSTAYLDMQWNHDDRELVGITIEPLGSATAPITLAQARNLASAAVGAGAALPPEYFEDTIGGTQGPSLVWKEHQTFVAVIVVEHHELIYTIFVRGSSGTLNTVKRAFRFVDPS